eukprot:4961664-Pyramimonas_sp.AAC.1
MDALNDTVRPRSGAPSLATGTPSAAGPTELSSAPSRRWPSIDWASSAARRAPITSSLITAATVKLRADFDAEPDALADIIPDGVMEQWEP